jgi:predicted secreted protein
VIVTKRASCRFLRAYPLVRLLFAVYFVVVHVFVFIVLAVHVHTVEMDTGPPIVSNRMKFVNSNTERQLTPAGFIAT